MTQKTNIFVASISGAALVLGGAYGWTAREYRAQELDALNERVAQLEQSSSAFAEKAGEADALQAQVAALQAELDSAREAAQAGVQMDTAAEAATMEDPAEETGEEAILAAALRDPDFGDPVEGEKVFKKCAACHQVGAGAEDRVGPHLNGLFGRRAGAHEGYRYSDDMQMMGADGLIWTLDKLHAYLENPKALVSRTRMNFAGLKKPEDRADLLAYLRQFSDNPQNIPEAQPTAQAREVELPPEILAIVGDPEYGEYLSSECKTCHQSDGQDDGIPSISFWPEEDFVIAMHAYKQKLRPHPVMQMMASRLSDEEIAALAAYFKGSE